MEKEKFSLTGFSTLDLIRKERGDAVFEQKDERAARVLVDDCVISEYTGLTNDWNSVMIKSKGDTMDSRVCIRYRCSNIASSTKENLKKYVSDEILTALKYYKIIK